MYGSETSSTEQMQRMGSASAGEIAQRGAEPLERRLANEPMNSTIRTACLIGAGASILGSLVMQMQGRKNEALFVGQWAPTLISFALWYQIVKSESQPANM
jgi:hypothetical protein